MANPYFNAAEARVAAVSEEVKQFEFRLALAKREAATLLVANT